MQRTQKFANVQLMIPSCITKFSQFVTLQ